MTRRVIGLVGAILAVIAACWVSIHGSTHGWFQ
jgi:hypothetical protein